MKKILFAIAFVMRVVIANAQRSDGFFKMNDVEEYNNRYNDGNGPEFVLPSGHGFDNDQTAPLGTGLLILTALGAGYAIKKKRS